MSDISDLAQRVRAVTRCDCDPIVKKTGDEAAEALEAQAEDIALLGGDDYALIAQIKRLRAALEKYGEHLPICGANQEYMVGGISTDVNSPPKARSVSGECTCGFSKALNNE